MLSIRPDQVKVFSQYLIDAFRQRMVRRTSEAYPKRFLELGEPGTLALIDRILKDALPGGIRNERDLAVLVESFLKSGAKAEDELVAPWARKILEAPSLPGSAKVQLLSDGLASRLAPPEAQAWAAI